MTVKTLIEENFLKPEECDSLIKKYEEHANVSIENQKIKPWLTVGGGISLPLEIFNANMEKRNKCPQFLFNKVSESAFKVNGSVLNWFQIVKWPSPNPGQDLHWDTAEETTSLACIIYLNDNFSGGETYFEDGTKFSPVKGRALFFDGNYHKHGVKSLNYGDRYVVAGWFNQGESPPQKISYIE